MTTEKRLIVLASRNQDKVREMRQLVAGLPFTVASSLDYPGLPDIIEDGTTPLGNATRKALVTAAYTGEIAVADDTSFQIRTLGGLPDIFASRFAGPDASYADNVRMALEVTRGVPSEDCDARFETSMVWIDPRPLAGLNPAAGTPAAYRWLHNPFARTISLAPTEDEDGFWNTLSDRRQEWHHFQAHARNLPVAWGGDRDRVLAILDDLVAPFLSGGRPSDAPPEAMRMPDTRLWAASGPDDQRSPVTRVCPSGLPAEAPGRATNGSVWLEMSSEGRLLGHLTREPVGSGGFGYDPIFVPQGLDLSLAELEPDEKNAISHRGRAMRRLLAAVQRVYGTA